MKNQKTLLLSMLALVLFSCNQVKLNLEDPTWAVTQIFIAAESGNYDILPFLCDPMGDGDGDTQDICNIKNADYVFKIGSAQEYLEMFNRVFQGGEVLNHFVSGNEAVVSFRFDGKRTEEMNMIKRDGKWYLYSF
tara:strand:+ start:211 stop:615 length:405 start_codon:yes stop_codon:yes gene_type:complete